MKALVLFPLAAALCLPALSAQDSDAAQAQSAELARVMSSVEETLKALENLVVTLESIKDTSSADAAAQKLPEIISALKRAEENIEAENAVSQEMQVQLAVKVMPAILNLMPRLEKSLQTLETNNCYGSQKLIDVLMNL